MNLVLIGYRGTGKSTIAKLLAVRLGRPVISLDEEIVQKAGMSIPDIVKEYSWEYFRDLEEELVGHYAAMNDQIIDAGGGVVTRPVNIERLRNNGLLFLLEATVEDIVTRIGGDEERPSLTGQKSFLEEVQEVLQQRQKAYKTAADFRIDTSVLSPEESAARISEIFLAQTDGTRR